MSESTPAPQVWPTLRAHDALALIEFLVEGFGFERTTVHAEDGSGREGSTPAERGSRTDRPSGFVGHAELSWPEGGGIMMGSARTESARGTVSADTGEADIWALAPGTFGAYVVTADPDAVFKRAIDHGARVLQQPADTSYGTRECALLDPEGNRWSFGTYRGAPR